MATIVTLRMYSGKPDPSWELSEDEVIKLKELLSKDKVPTFEMSALSAVILGYRGFEIQSFTADLPNKLFCFDGIVDIRDQTQLNYIDKDSEIESFLASTGASALAKEEKNFIEGEISKNVKGGTAGITKALKAAISLLAVPPFDPGKWNIPSVQPYNNCYNYANDKITNTFAQPGRGSGSTIADILCPTVTQASQRDGQISVAPPSSTPAQGHFIALVSANHPFFKDYHWYRLDSSGKWSHKPGGTAATNLDNSGSLISDPRISDRGYYSDFCGFFHCIPSQTIIR